MDAFHLRSPLGVGKLDRCVMLGVISSSEEAFLKFLMILQRMKISTVARILFYGPLHCWNSGCICRRCKNERMAAHVWNRRCLLRFHKLIISARLRIQGGGLKGRLSRWWGFVLWRQGQLLVFNVIRILLLCQLFPKTKIFLLVLYEVWWFSHRLQLLPLTYKISRLLAIFHKLVILLFLLVIEDLFVLIVSLKYRYEVVTHQSLGTLYDL